jgi:copper chaperone CopZ
MKLSNTLFAFILVLGFNSASADSEKHAHHNHDSHNHEHHAESLTDGELSSIAGVEGAVCKNLIDVKVNGLVCDFCARALEKVFSKQPAVAGIDVNLDKGHVSIALQDGGQMDDSTLGELITDSGYNVVDIQRGCS